MGQTVLCYPLIFENSDFYLSHDMALLIDDIKNELNFVGKYWRMSGRPTVCLILREEHLRDANFKEMLDMLVECKNGCLKSSGLKVKIGRLQNLISSSCIEHLDFFHTLSDEELPKLQSFRQLEHTYGLGYQVRSLNFLHTLYISHCQICLWLPVTCKYPQSHLLQGTDRG